MDIDIEKKREELTQLWNDSFDIVQLQIARIKSGELQLKGAFLAELNKFLRASREALKELEVEQQMAEQRASFKQAMSGGEEDDSEFQASLRTSIHDD